MKRYLMLLSLFAVSLSFGEEKSYTIKLKQPLEMFGGFSAGYFYSTNTDSKDSSDKFQITNAIIGLKGKAGEDIKIGFELVIGGSLWATVFDGGQRDFAYYDTDSKELKEGVGLHWGYATLEPFKGIEVQAGVLTTNIGYELADTYSNPNITFGAVWNAQPFIYPGARINFDLKELVNIPLGFYAEYNQDSNKDNYALGINGEFSRVSFALNYYDYRAKRNLVDLVLGYTISNVDLGLNFDWQWLDDSAKQPGRDDNAWGVALYFIPKFETQRGEVSIPVRLEYFDEGTSGIYSGSEKDNNGWSVTVTPTYRPSPNTFVRVEYAYLNTDKKVINGEDNKTTLSAEIGFTF